MCTIIDKRIKPGKYIYKLVGVDRYLGLCRVTSAFQNYVWVKGINEAGRVFVTLPVEKWGHGTTIWEGAFHGFASLYLAEKFFKDKGSWIPNKKIIRVKALGDTFIGEADNFEYEYDGCPQMLSTKVEWDGTVLNRTTRKWEPIK